MNGSPHSNQDGDLYAIIWNQDLIPSKECKPMDFNADLTKEQPNEVTLDDIKNFYYNFLRNDNLGRIANAHKVWADFQDDGAACAECLELAELHSLAVDFNKSGVPAIVRKELLQLKAYPHFMEKDNKNEYKSRKVLGRIHDRVCDMRHPRVKDMSVTVYPDPDLLVPHRDDFKVEAERLMEDYNRALAHIMVDFDLFNETEIMSGSVVKFSRKVTRSSKTRDGDAQERLNKVVKDLRESFMADFEEDVKDNWETPVTGDVIYDTLTMQKASAWYEVAYTQPPQNNKRPFLSFAWIPYKVLCAVKIHATPEPSPAF